MQAIDNFLNKITMYRLLVYTLSFLSVLAVGFSFLGRIHASPTALVVSLFLLLVSAYTADRGFSWFLGIPSNRESWLITGLILFLIIQPAHSIPTGIALVLAGGISSVSKYLVAYNGRHIFNPAALTAAFMTFWGVAPTTWWVGGSMFWPFTLLFGLAIVRKIRRFPLVLTFAVVSIGLQSFLFAHSHQLNELNIKHMLIASPLIFLATVMLTEPATMPPRRNLQMMFASLIAILYVTAWKVGPLIIYPELALLIGNAFAWIISPKFRVRLQLKEIQKVSDRVYNYIFQPERRFAFLPGQYMEWTLPYVPYDSRGNRRTFTIASSPTEDEVHLGIKYYEPASMYKAAFAELQPGDVVYASQLAGNFTLKGNENKKLVFIAGGIGITPFRSMVKYLSDQKQSCDVVLLYIVGDPREFAYAKQLREAAGVGVKIVPIVTNPAYKASNVVTTDVVDSELLASLVPDYSERLFYISGPNAMVESTKHYLQHLHVPKRHIKTDHFSGY